MTIYYEPQAKGVFYVEVTGKRYQLNYYEAHRLCEINRATLATYDQLLAAWEVGLVSPVCACKSCLKASAF